MLESLSSATLITDTTPIMKIYTFFIGFIVAGLAVYSQNPVINHPDMTAGEYYHYIYSHQKQTDPPRGFKPFYISHYGRHGSRYHTNSYYMDEALKPLLKADTLHILTDSGAQLLKDLQQLTSKHEGHYGMLTELGINEQKAIAHRIIERFPELGESSNGRNKVIAQSSLLPRCLTSMTHFLTTFQSGRQLNIKAYCSDSIQQYIAPSVNLKQMFALEKRMEDSMRKRYCPPENFIKRIFSDPITARHLMDSPYQWMKMIINAGSICFNMEGVPNLFKHFTIEELKGAWTVRNAREYFAFGNSRDYPTSTHDMAIGLLGDFIRRCDIALVKGSDMVADFRFGHDSVVLPFASYIGLEGFNGGHYACQVDSIFNCTESVCMATNIQFVFYRNKKGNTLVKCLYNERERQFPALQAINRYYYSWEALRSYLLQLL